MSLNAKGRWTVLVVEDEEVVRMAVLDEFQERGFDALGARDPMTALPILKSDRAIDLLITDIGLPGFDGRRLVDMARDLRPELRVLFLTGYSIGDDAEIPPRTKFIEKPIDLNLLARLAQEMLQET